MVQSSLVSTPTQLADSTSLRPSTRDYYIDRLRSVMTALVIFHHTAITYGGSGGWFWTEHTPSADPSSLLLTLFCATNQAYFMGFFFLLAGYFTPASLERKGYSKFLLDRLLRLGIPLLAFILILGPATAGIVTAFEGDGFWPTIQFLWVHQRIINGPLWFAEALLIFALGYVAWRAFLGAPLPTPPGKTPRIETAIPANWKWLLSAVLITIANVLIRQIVPTGKNVFGLQLGFFPAYIFLFALGITARRHDWIRQLNWAKARLWVWVMVLAWPAMPIGIAYARHVNGIGKTSFSSGFSWAALLYASWEPFVAWGAICLWLLLFRKYMNQPSPFWDWLNRRAYAVYIIHPLTLVTIALLFHPWGAPPLIKFAVTGIVTCLATWLLSHPLVRLPGLRRIV